MFGSGYMPPMPVPPPDDFQDKVAGCSANKEHERTRERLRRRADDDGLVNGSLLSMLFGFWS